MASETKTLFEGTVHQEVGFFQGGWQPRRAVVLDNGELTFFDKNNKKVLQINVNSKTIQYSEAKKKQHLLRLADNKTSYYLHTDSAADKIAFIRAVCGAGAKWLKDKDTAKRTIFNSAFSMEGSADDSEICIQDVNEWSPENVLQFISKLFGSNNLTIGDLYGDIFLEQLVDGKKLINIVDTQSYATIGMYDENDISVLRNAVIALKEDRMFHEGQFAVFGKIQNMMSSRSTNIDNMNTFMKNLSDKDLLKEKYLQLSKIKEFLKTKDFSIMKDSKLEDEDTLSKDLKEVQEAITGVQPEMFKHSFPVKLIITEIAQMDNEKMLRAALSPFASIVPNISQKYGMFHSALVVGPWYLEWTDSSLCIPRRIMSNTALISADVASIDSAKDDVDALAEKIADIVTHWNVHYTYTNYKLLGKNSSEGNCQDFVEAVLKKLGIQMQNGTALQKYLHKMKTRGLCEMEFEPPAELRKFVPSLAEKVVFASHEELDRYFKSIVEKVPTFRLDYPAECELLKSFDRAFWLRHLKKNNAANAPLEGNGCPFGDPRVSLSYAHP